MSPMTGEQSVVGPASSHVLETEIDGDISIYNAETEEVTILNGTASDIWRLADGTYTIKEITRLLSTAYGVTDDEISPDVAATVEKLTSAGLLEQR
jgi:hypothetical protein